MTRRRMKRSDLQVEIGTNIICQVRDLPRICHTQNTKRQRKKNEADARESTTTECKGARGPSAEGSKSGREGGGGRSSSRGGRGGVVGNWRAGKDGKRSAGREESSEARSEAPNEREEKV